VARVDGEGRRQEGARSGTVVMTGGEAAEGGFRSVEVVR